MEIKNKLTVTRGEREREIIGERRGRVIKEHVERTHGQGKQEREDEI